MFSAHSEENHGEFGDRQPFPTAGGSSDDGLAGFSVMISMERYMLRSVVRSLKARSLNTNQAPFVLCTGLKGANPEARQKASRPFGFLTGRAGQQMAVRLRNYSHYGMV